MSYSPPHSIFEFINLYESLSQHASSIESEIDGFSVESEDDQQSLRHFQRSVNKEISSMKNTLSTLLSKNEELIVNSFDIAVDNYLAYETEEIFPFSEWFSINQENETGNHSISSQTLTNFFKQLYIKDKLLFSLNFSTLLEDLNKCIITSTYNSLYRHRYTNNLSWIENISKEIEFKELVFQLIINSAISDNLYLPENLSKNEFLEHIEKTKTTNKKTLPVILTAAIANHKSILFNDIFTHILKFTPNLGNSGEKFFHFAEKSKYISQLYKKNSNGHINHSEIDIKVFEDLMNQISVHQNTEEALKFVEGIEKSLNLKAYYPLLLAIIEQKEILNSYQMKNEKHYVSNKMKI